MSPTTAMTKMDTIKQLLVANKARIATALPAHIKPDRMIRVTLNALESTPELLACTPTSLYRCVMEASTYGWEIGGPLAEAYIVPFKDQATLIPGYRGLLNLVTRTGTVKEVIRQVVKEGDTFLIDPINGITHQFGADRGEWTHVYVCAKYHDASLSQPFVMTKQEVLNHRDRYAKGAKRGDSPWQTEEIKMALKTVIRQFITGGYVQTSSEIVGFAQREGIVEGSVVRETIPMTPQLQIGTDDELVAEDAIETVTQQTPTTPDESWDISAEFQKSLDSAETEPEIEEVRTYYFERCKNDDQRAHVGLTCDDALTSLAKANQGELPLK